MELTLELITEEEINHRAVAEGLSDRHQARIIRYGPKTDILSTLSTQPLTKEEFATMIHSMKQNPPRYAYILCFDNEEEAQEKLRTYKEKQKFAGIANTITKNYGEKTQ